MCIRGIAATLRNSHLDMMSAQTSMGAAGCIWQTCVHHPVMWVAVLCARTAPVRMLTMGTRAFLAIIRTRSECKKVDVTSAMAIHQALQTPTESPHLISEVMILLLQRLESRGLLSEIFALLAELLLQRGNVLAMYSLKIVKAAFNPAQPTSKCLLSALLLPLLLLTHCTECVPQTLLHDTKSLLVTPYRFLQTARPLRKISAHPPTFVLGVLG